MAPTEEHESDACDMRSVHPIQFVQLQRGQTNTFFEYCSEMINLEHFVYWPNAIRLSFGRVW
jgi:hypothetical protein